METEIPQDIIKPKTSQQNSSVQALLASYSGPIPSASELQRYENIQPGFAERIITMAEKEAEHRHSVTKYLTEQDKYLQKKGQIIGGVIAILGIACATALGICGSPGVGIAIAGGALAPSLILGLIGQYTQYKKNKDSLRGTMKE